MKHPWQLGNTDRKHRGGYPAANWASHTANKQTKRQQRTGRRSSATGTHRPHVTDDVTLLNYPAEVVVVFKKTPLVYLGPHREC